MLHISKFLILPPDSHILFVFEGIDLDDDEFDDDDDDMDASLDELLGSSKMTDDLFS